jgi:cyclase
MDDFTKLFKEVPSVSAGLAASVFHFGEIAIPDLKKELRRNDIEVRLV